MKEREREMEKTLKALANRRRLLILTFLKKRRTANVGEAADAIKLSFKATSKHLVLLIGAEIVEREQRGPQMFYRLSEALPAIARDVISRL